MRTEHKTDYFSPKLGKIILQLINNLNKMFKPRPCGCKGIRTCLICEAEFGIQKVDENQATTLDIESCYEFCFLCGSKAWMGSNVWRQHPNHDGKSVDYPGVLLIPDFISKEEEDELVKGCDSMEWDLSQSGRRKQNFGPKTNFKKMKINGKSFRGFPSFSEFVQKKLNEVPLLKDFQTIEQCAIEYRPETGACIDPHIDDCWVWGERVISLNLISDSALTMTKYSGGIDKYNLRFHYEHSKTTPTIVKNCEDQGPIDQFPVVRLPMPVRSLLVLYGPSRYKWEHCIIRNDIQDRRICMAYREFTPSYLKGGELYDDIGKYVCDKAMEFWESPE